jgi:hypothetical protein
VILTTLYLAGAKNIDNTYHAKAEVVVPVRRNDATNEVAQGRDT